MSGDAAEVLYAEQEKCDEVIFFYTEKATNILLMLKLQCNIDTGTYDNLEMIWHKKIWNVKQRMNTGSFIVTKQCKRSEVKAV